MQGDSETYGGAQMSALKTILMALEEAGAERAEPVEILIRVHGKEDRTLKISLENTREIRQILKITTGMS